MILLITVHGGLAVCYSLAWRPLVFFSISFLKAEGLSLLISPIIYSLVLWQL